MATWGDRAALHLLDNTVCPRCDTRLSVSEQCPRCRADLSGEAGTGIRTASLRAAEALQRREALVNALPSEAVVIREIERPVPAASRAPRAVVGSEGSSISVQSVLAVAGAGLLGVAAIVFTFLNPDLTDFATRTLIIGGTTALFLGGAWLLARVGLQFSAESVGALGVVFLVLDLWALSQVAPDRVNGWWFVAVGTLVSSAVLIGLARVARIRAWSAAGIVGVALVPAFVGYALGGEWFALLGNVLSGFTALALHGLLARLARTFDTALRFERAVLTTLQILAVVFALGGLAMLVVDSPVNLVLPAAATLLTLALLAVLSTRNQAARFWSFVAGGLGVTAVAILPLLAELDFAGILGLAPVASAVGLVALTAAPLPRSTYRIPLALGAWIPLIVVSIPAVGFALLQLVFRYAPASLEGFTLALGVAAAAAGTAGMAVMLMRRKEAALVIGGMVTALWLGALAVVTFALSPVFLPIAQVGLLVAASLVVTWTLARPVAGWPVVYRAPLLVLAHFALLLAAGISSFDPSIAAVGGAVVAGAILVVSRSVPGALRPLHVAAAYAWALAVFAHGLALANVEWIAVLCLTTTLASLGALAATLVHRLRVGAWYAILLVTFVPFLIGIASVIAERSGWTALSTGVTFLLAVTLVTTRRPGLNRAVRTLAAALLVPALAVVVICLGAQVLLVSASPITLPVIAAIVALALPSTAAIGRALTARGIPDADARAARIAIEVSSLVTAAIAVLLALVRAAAGLGTSFTVLVILGIGAAAAGLVTRRRYAWAVSAASFTGALWSFWALLGVTELEPYLLPPALGAVLVGTLLVWRKHRGREFYAAGLGVAILSTLGNLALGGQPLGTWRLVGLLVGSAVLAVAGALIRRSSALRVLVVPTLIASILAALAGVVQAARFGFDLDVSVFGRGEAAMLPVLGLSALAVGLSIVAARILSTTVASRWLYAPAVLYAVAGPISAVREGWLPILTLLALALGMLGLMLVTVMRARTRDVTLPPVWFTFAVAWSVAVASWSERELRVEAYSLPLGLALIAAGVIASRADKGGAGTLASWPIGFTGSWRLLAPGILVTFVPSVLATGTDPRTERAVLVIGLALAAILIGSLRKLAAPFILGIVVLPIENLVVFVVQVGRSIGAAPWWITLATAGAVLLVIAVTSERRSAGARGVSARLRDLT